MIQAAVIAGSVAAALLVYIGVVWTLLHKTRRKRHGGYRYYYSVRS